MSKKKILLPLLPALLGICLFAAWGLPRLFWFHFLPEYPLPAGAEERPYCPLCVKRGAQFPVFLDLCTGQTSEIRMHGSEGVMHTGGWLGGSYHSLPGEGKAWVSVRKEALYQYSPAAARLSFCDDCLAAIEAFSPAANCVVADCREPGAVRFYDLKEAARGLSMEHYAFSVTDMQSDRCTIKIQYLPNA